MVRLFRRKEEPPPAPAPERVPLPGMRDLLFADLDAEAVLRVFGTGPRPAPLAALAAAVACGDRPAARVALSDVLIRHPETRQWLQAWTLARQAGLPPSDTARRARGVVVDMGLEAGVDTVAGYDDGSARYLNQSGGGVFWDAESNPDVAIIAGIDTLLAAGQAVVDSTLPLDGGRPAPPAHGMAMIAILTEGGIHLGTGTADTLSRDPLGGPVIAAAITLMVALIDVSQKSGPKQPGNPPANPPA
jgi:hypothetical protein